MDQRDESGIITSEALDRSIRLLDSAINSPGKSLFRLSKKSTKQG